MKNNIPINKYIFILKYLHLISILFVTYSISQYDININKTI